MAPFCIRDSATGTVRYWCCRCQLYYDASRFVPSSLRRRVSRCRVCRSRAEVERRTQSPDAEAAHCLYELERKRFGRAGGSGLFPLSLVQRIFERFGRRSVLSDRTDKLRLRRFWPDLPFSEWNAVVVTADENKSIGHCANWLTRFPAPFVRLMVAMRRARLNL